MDYPYLVVRFAPAFYNTVGLEVFPHELVDGEYTPEARERLIEEGRQAHRTNHFRCCVVFGPADCVYIEHDYELPSIDVPSGWTEITLAEPQPEPEPRVPRWTDAFRRSRIGEHIWTCRWGAFLRLARAAEEAGIEDARYRGSAPFWGGCDRWAIAILDGGLLDVRRDGFILGSLHGNWLIGDTCLRWACDVLEVRPPRRLAPIDVPLTLTPTAFTSDALAQVAQPDRLRALVN